LERSDNPGSTSRELINPERVKTSDQLEGKRNPVRVRS